MIEIQQDSVECLQSKFIPVRCELDLLPSIALSDQPKRRHFQDNVGLVVAIEEKLLSLRSVLFDIMPQDDFVRIILTPVDSPFHNHLGDQVFCGCQFNFDPFFYPVLIRFS